MLIIFYSGYNVGSISLDWAGTGAVFSASKSQLISVMLRLVFIDCPFYVFLIYSSAIAKDTLLHLDASLGIWSIALCAARQEDLDSDLYSPSRPVHLGALWVETNHKRFSYWLNVCQCQISNFKIILWDEFSRFHWDSGRIQLSD